MARRKEPSNNPELWRRTLHGFIRRFGLLEEWKTPCGTPMPVSNAHALMEMLHHPEMTQNELSERLGLTKSAVSRLVARLETNGQVHRLNDDRDRRARRLHLTGKGMRLARQVNRNSLERFTTLMEAIPRSRRGQVLESIELIVEATPRQIPREDDETSL